MKTQNKLKQICAHNLRPDDMEKNTVSTLLIPENLWPAFQRKIQQHGKLRFYFKHLLYKYEQVANLYEEFHAHRVKRRYQERGLNLRRKNFLPDNEDWLYLTETARGLNVSRCNLFVFLMKIELSEEGMQLTGDDCFPYGVPNRSGQIIRALHPAKLLRFISNCHPKQNRYLRELKICR